MQVDLKTAAVAGLELSGVTRLLRPFYGGRGAIMGLHRVLPEGERDAVPDNVIHTQHLRAILHYLRRSHWDCVGLDQVPERLKGGAGARRFVAFTLDDGYADNLEHALPLFEEFSIPFTVFAVTGFLNRSVPCWPMVLPHLIEGGAIALEHPQRGRLTYRCETGSVRNVLYGDGWKRWEIEAAAAAACRSRGVNVGEIMDRVFLSWEQLQRIAHHPLGSVGCHTVSHPALAALPLEQARNEIEPARRELEARLGAAVRHIAYPYGSCGQREFELAESAGFTTGSTTKRGNLHAAHAHRLWSLPRHTLCSRPHYRGTGYLSVSLDGIWDSPLGRRAVSRRVEKRPRRAARGGTATPCQARPPAATPSRKRLGGPSAGRAVAELRFPATDARTCSWRLQVAASGEAG